ncbi:SufS family cysteine desulfurase [uncultured Ruminococcus sp.]|uniref:aminotransferase class V-fold PLP-dependent enzyme n=1 Tax=uncultured Ruminococcus sp. TaxID=165186 RepID=UPI003459C4BE
MLMNSFTKSDFHVFQANSGLVYLDSSATQQKPLAVLERVERYYREENANPLRGLYELGVKATEAYENAREAVRKFIGAKSVREIVFTRNATESLNLIAYSWGRSNIGEGDEVLVAISEHHSDLLPWQTLCKEKGAELKYLECGKSGRYTEEALRDALSERTKLFCIAQISNVFGRLNPIKRFAEICRENGTLIVCDAAQSAPHIAVDVQKLGVDFLAFSGHKMLAPMGIGVLYGREELLESMPPFLYGGEMIDTVTRCGASFAELPHKFEAGTVNAGGAVGLHAAIDYISELGLDEIERREEKLTALAFGEMKKIPHVNIIGADDPQEHHGILTFTVDGVHPHDIAAIFDAENIAVRAGHHCAQPLFHFLGIPSAARMSLAFYNDEEDIMRFIAVLKTLRRRMGYDG